MLLYKYLRKEKYKLECLASILVEGNCHAIICYPSCPLYKICVEHPLHVESMVRLIVQKDIIVNIAIEYIKENNITKADLLEYMF